MNTQLKVLSILSAALAVVFSTAGVSMGFNAPGEMANCRSVDSGLTYECDPVSNLVVVNSGVIPVTGLGFPSFGTSLSDFAITLPVVPVLGLSDFALTLPVVPVLSLSDFALTLPIVPVLSLSDFAISAAGLENLSLSDFAISAIGLDNISLSDFAMAYQESMVSEDNIFLMDESNTGTMYGSGYYGSY